MFVALLFLLLAPVARAELILFSDGGWLPVTGFEVDGNDVRLDLHGGGRLVVSILRIERILDDEIVAADELAAPEEPAGAARFNVGFEKGQAQPDTPYGDLIFTAAETHGLNPAVVAAVVRAESAFDAAAISVKGAQGLMQLMPATAKRFGLEGDDVFDPAKNLDAGTRYLSWLNARFEGRLDWILAAYNAGEGTVDRYDGVPPYRETRGFVHRILSDLGLETEEGPPPDPE